jgi:hypothetical protein
MELLEPPMNTPHGIAQPERRLELITNLRALADVEFQRYAWVGPEAETMPDCFDFAVNILFDDSRIFDNPQREIGWIVRDKEEAAAVHRVAKAVDRVLREVGDVRDDAIYLASRGWPTVVEEAARALEILLRNDARARERTR